MIGHCRAGVVADEQGHVVLDPNSRRKYLRPIRCDNTVPRVIRSHGSSLPAPTKELDEAYEILENAGTVTEITVEEHTRTAEDRFMVDAWIVVVYFLQ